MRVTSNSYNMNFDTEATHVWNDIKLYQAL